jgi:UDP-N-acetyl-2-amino-2-deoxyglucuronate dehydrogenase
MRNGKVGFGVVGTGMAGGIHAAEFPFVRGAELVAACSRNETNLREFAAKFRVPETYTDYRELIDSPNVDVVIVLVPTGLHRDVAVYAARSGKHVIVEKPLDINLERADEIIWECQKAGTKLGVIFQMRFGAVANAVKKAVDDGALGQIFLADAFDKASRTTEYYQSAAWRGTLDLEGGGCLMTQSIHITDLLQHVVGPIASVVGKVATMRHDIEVEDTASALVNFENGAMGVIQSTSSVSPALKSNLQIHGVRGTIVANAQYDQVLFWDVKDYPCPIPVEKCVSLGDIDDPWDYPQTRHRIQLQDMVDAIHEGRDPILTGEDARKSLAVNMAIYESSRTGREVFLNEAPYVPQFGQKDSKLTIR